ncbi:hypothetical protein L1887_38505 [Cichorium endivia]|nr:hypothetical protein L1887_38505 [Cichorium endivia]
MVVRAVLGDQRSMEIGVGVTGLVAADATKKGDAKAQALKVAKAVKTGSTFKKKAKKIRTKLLKAEVLLVADGDVVLDATSQAMGGGEDAEVVRRRHCRRGMHLFSGMAQALSECWIFKQHYPSWSMLIGSPVDGQSSDNVVKGMSDC